MLLHKSVEFDSRVLREARSLAGAGHAVTIVQLAPVAATDALLPGGARLVSALPGAWARRLLPFHAYRLVFLAVFVLRLLRLRPEVVHAHDAAMLAPGAIGAWLCGARLVYDSHELATGVPYRERAWALLVAALEWTLVRRCDAVITVSDGIADRIRARYRLRIRPTVVRNVTELALEDSRPPERTVRARLGLRDEPLVLHQGAAARDRGCENLVRALPALPASHLLFLGDGDPGFDERLAELAASLGVARRVHFLPSVALEELLAHTAEADVGVSLLEDTCDNHRLALPNKVFEYVAAGVPVVASALPELDRLVRGHGIGWTVDSGDPGDIGRGLGEALAGRADGPLRVRLGRAASELRWEREQMRLIDLYSELDRHGGPPAEGGALVLVRNAATHDARILREARLLERLGLRPRVVGVVSTLVPETEAEVEGVRVERLAPTSPVAAARRLARRLHPKGALPSLQASAPRQIEESAPNGRSGLSSLAIRLHRWLVTLDYYRRGTALVRRSRPGLVHCNDYNTMWIGAFARLRGSAVVYDAHELWPDRNLRPEPRWWLLLCEALFVRLAHHTVTTSPAYAREMARRYRTSSPTVVRNIPEVGVEAPRQTAKRRPPDLSGSRHRAPVAVYVGALTRNRGLEESVAAIARVPDARLRFVGPASNGYGRRLEAIAEELGVSGRVEVRGAVAPSGVVDALRDADVGLALIQPACLSYRLTLPNKLFEYVAAGLPVLGSDLPAIAEFIEGNGVGLTVDPLDPDDTAAGLAEMLKPERREHFAAAARRAAVRETWQGESEKLAAVYGQALEAAGR
jgi:glycosyltransferase involved in cell wall biosynthesis